MSLQYLKKKKKDEVDLLHPINIKNFLKIDFNIFGHQSLLQGDTTTINGHDLAFSKYSR